jgi:hypothetical protein
MPRVASAGPLPEGATAGQIARAAGVSERVILGRKADGRLPVRDDGAVDLYAVIRAGIAALAAKQKAEATGGDSADDLDANRARESRLRGDKLELINAQLRADLVPADEMEAALGQAFDAVRGKVLALPSRAAPLLLGLRTSLDIQDKLTELVHDACGDLAASEAVATVKDRTRRRAGRGASGDADAEEAGATT